MLISTKDEMTNDDLSLIDQDVAGEPLSDDDDDATLASTTENDADASVQENDVFRSSTKDPIEGDLFEGDISGVRIVAKSDFDDHNATIKNAIVNTYQVTRNLIFDSALHNVVKVIKREDFEQHISCDKFLVACFTILL